MIVRYNATNQFTIGSPSINEGALYKFVPGINIIDKALWSDLEKDPLIKHKIKKRVLEVLQSKDGTEIATGEPSVDMIGEMFDMIKLETMTTSKNKKVAAAAKLRLIELNEPEETFKAAKRNADREED